MFMSKKFKVFLGLALVIMFFVCGGPGSCIPSGEDNQQGPGTNTGGGGYPGGPGYPGGGTFNGIPWVNITTPSMQIAINSKVNLSANAGDPDNDPLTFEWGSSNGFFMNMSSPTVEWTSPNFSTSAKIWVKVRDGRGGEGYAETFINVGGSPPPNPGGANRPPQFTDVHSDFNMVGPSGKVRLFATAFDPDFDMITFNWRMINPGGIFSNPGPGSPSCDWTAPNVNSGPPSYEFVCEARDNKGGYTESLHLWIYMNYGGGTNQPPNGFTITASPMNNIGPDGIVNLTATASDPDNDVLLYNWEAMSDSPGTLPGVIGTFLPGPAGSPLSWRAPHINGSQVGNRSEVWFTINCKLDDQHGHFDYRFISVEVKTDTTH